MQASAKPSLPDLQRWMRWVITRPEGAEQTLVLPQGRAAAPADWTRGPEPRRWLSVIGDTPELNKYDRLSIYGEGYFLRIVDCLGSIYDSLRTVVGEHEFSHHLARQYLVKHPSYHRCIDNVGSDMPDFLKRHPETKTFRFLPDLARLEWAYHEAFYADERPDLDYSAMNGRSLDEWAKATVLLDPSVHLLSLKYPVVDLWREDGRWSRRRLKAMNPKPTFALVYRRRDALVRVAALEPAAYLLLSRLQDGKTFGSAVKSAARLSKAAPSRVMEWFRMWAENGVLREVRFR